MAIGKYIMNVGIISSLISGVGVAKKAKEAPADWRRYLIWSTWVISVVLSIASVHFAEQDREFIEQKRADEKEVKRRQKEMKKELKKRA